MAVMRSAPNAGHFYSNIVSPVKVDLQFTVDNTATAGISSLKSNGYVVNVIMNTSGSSIITGLNPAAGYALVQFKNNFNHYLGSQWSFEPPVTGSAIAISGSGLTTGVGYQIVSVGTVPLAKFTVTTIADVSNNSAGKYWTASDAFGNNYVFYNVVSGNGTAPSLTGALAGYQAVPVAYATNATANSVATAVGVSVGAVNNSNSFTTSVLGNVVTVTSTVANQTLAPAPSAQNSGFTVSAVVFTSLQADWQHVGLMPGLTPTVGQSFIATATGGSLGTGTVKAVGVSGIMSVETVGVTDTSIATSSVAQYGGAWVLVKFLNTSGSPTAPTQLTVVSMSFEFDQSSVTVDGL